MPIFLFYILTVLSLLHDLRSSDVTSSTEMKFVYLLGVTVGGSPEIEHAVVGLRVLCNSV